MAELPLLALTLGDPSGIGPEVIVKALARDEVRATARVVVVGSLAVVREAIEAAGSALTVEGVLSPIDRSSDPDAIQVLAGEESEPVSFPLGRHSEASGHASHDWVEQAARLALDGAVDAIVTAPVNKESWRMAGSVDVGHQEVFKRLSGAETVATMLVTGGLRCVHLSTHLPLEEACRAVTHERVLRYLRLTHRHFQDWGVTEPRIAVAALNPHGSDGGLLGDTEAREIAPAVREAVSEGIAASGPIPADSVFSQAIGGLFDAVLVMYHDQGHIAIKVHGLEESVSVNLGLPFLRTSVDHGTAFDIVGRNQADETSMVEAIKLAARLAQRQGLA